MAFESINKYTVFLMELIEKNHRDQEKPYDPEKKDERHALYQNDNLLVDILTEWYETLKAIPKFKVQKANVRRVLFDLYPSYSKGYFKSDQ